MKTRFPLSAAALGVSLLISACSQPAEQNATTEILQEAAWRETMEIQGEVIAPEKTPVNVPGSGWAPRILEYIAQNGNAVKKGDLIARYRAPRSETELAKAELELERKELAREELERNDTKRRTEIHADQSKVNADLHLSERYSDADQQLFSRNKVLDTIQDQAFLKQKQGYLNWQLSQTSVRTQSDQALLRSQLESVTQKRDTEANALQQLEVRAPHDGFLMLEKNWSGMTPMVGATARPGDVIGNLPDLSHLVANFQIPEQRTFALQTGQTIEVRLMGSGKHVPLKVTRIGTTASPIGEKSPVKFIEVDAAFSAEHIQQMQLTPGQSLSGNLIFANKEKILTVPNIALKEENGQFFVFRIEQGKPVKTAVKLGLRGPTRSEITEGLRAGMQISLIPTTEQKEKSAS